MIKKKTLGALLAILNSTAAWFTSLEQKPNSTEPSIVTVESSPIQPSARLKACFTPGNEDYFGKHKAFSPDGKFVAISTATMTSPKDTVTRCVKIWSTSDGQLKHSLEINDPKWNPTSQYAARVNFSDDSQLIAACSVHGHVKIWNVSSGSLVSELEEKEDKDYFQEYLHPFFSPDNKVLILVNYLDDRFLKAWNIETRASIFKIPSRFMEFFSRGQFILTEGTEKMLQVREAATGRITASLDINPINISGLTISPKNDFFVASYFSPEPAIGVFSLPEGSPLYTLTLNGPCLNLVISSNTQLIATSDTSSCKIWNRTDGSLVCDIPEAASAFTIKFSPCSRYIITTQINEAKIWHAMTGKLMNTLKVDANSFVVAIGASEEGFLLREENLCSATIKIWELGIAATPELK